MVAKLKYVGDNKRKIHSGKRMFIIRTSIFIKSHWKF